MALNQCGRRQGDEPGDDRRSQCRAGLQIRKSWIRNGNPVLDGRSPAAFGMDAWGECADYLHVQDDDCSRRRMLAAYGSKPFMREARDLGFVFVMCGEHSYGINDIVRE